VNGRNNRRWVLAARTPGLVGREHFTWDEVTVPPLTDGQFLVRNLWLSCDPAQRAWMETDTYIPDAAARRGHAVGRSGRRPRVAPSRIRRRRSRDRALQVAGLRRQRQGAAQVAQIKGARVVGIAGGPEKCAWLAELGLDAAIDYKSEDASARIAELCPDGIDVYFDNVGGPLLDVALMNLATGARIVCCGAISGYGGFEERPAIHNHQQLILKRATMAGFLLFDHADRFAAATAELATWAAERRIITRVDIVDGLENAPDALRRLFIGQNIGKQLVRLEPAVA
jgi:NADPH-dependent curcumin reductase